MRNIFWILSLCLCLTACKDKSPPPTAEKPDIPVIVETPVVLDIQMYVETFGTTSPSTKQEVISQVEGIIQAVLVSEGEWVQHRTPLIQIDSAPYKNKVREAQAQAAIDRAALEASRKKMERYKTLAKQNLIAQTEWEELEAAAEKAQGTLELSLAKLAAAELDLQNCTLCAFAEGRVGTITAYAGMYIAKGHTDPLTTISKIDPLDVEFTLTHAEVLKLPKGQLRIQITPLGLPGSTHAQLIGEATFLDHHFNPETGLLLGRGSAANHEQTLRSGQSVRVKIPVDMIKQAILIPQKAVRFSPEGAYAYVVQPDTTVAVKQIVISGEYQDKAIISAGLDPTDQVVTDGHLRLAAGAKVKIKS